MCVNGTKRFITNANRAGLFTLMARTDPDKKGAAGISAFLVPREPAGRLGRQAREEDGPAGRPYLRRRSSTMCACRRELRLGAEGEGFKVAMQVLDRGRLHISGVCVGVAERLIADCVAYAARAQAVRPADRRDSS